MATIKEQTEKTERLKTALDNKVDSIGNIINTKIKEKPTTLTQVEDSLNRKMLGIGDKIPIGAVELDIKVDNTKKISIANSGTLEISSVNKDGNIYIIRDSKYIDIYTKDGFIQTIIPTLKAGSTIRSVYSLDSQNVFFIEDTPRDAYWNYIYIHKYNIQSRSQTEIKKLEYHAQNGGYLQCAGVSYKHNIIGYHSCSNVKQNEAHKLVYYNNVGQIVFSDISLEIKQQEAATFEDFIVYGKNLWEYSYQATNIYIRSLNTKETFSPSGRIGDWTLYGLDDEQKYMYLHHSGSSSDQGATGFRIYSINESSATLLKTLSYPTYVYKGLDLDNCLHIETNASTHVRVILNNEGREIITYTGEDGNNYLQRGSSYYHTKDLQISTDSSNIYLGKKPTASYKITSI